MEKMILPSTLAQSCGSTPAGTNMEKAWTSIMTPGPEHDILASEDGTWDEEIFFYAQPGAAPQKAHAVCVNEMILGGRFQRSTHVGNIMGMPLEGECISGYDDGRKIFFSTWIDNMGTDMMYSEGQYDTEKKRIEYIGKCTDPASGKIMGCKQYLIFRDANNMTIERYIASQGQEFMSMEIRFTRKT